MFSRIINATIVLFGVYVGIMLPGVATHIVMLAALGCMCMGMAMERSKAGPSSEK